MQKYKVRDFIRNFREVRNTPCTIYKGMECVGSWVPGKNQDDFIEFYKDKQVAHTE